MKRKNFHDLGGKIFAVIFIIIGLSFLSSNLTGYAIGGLNKITLDFTGFLFFIIGIMGLFVFLRKRE